MDRNDILDVTEALFATKNVHFTLAEVSEKLSIKPPSLYNHFSSKEEIIKFTILREYENLHKYIEAIFVESKEEKAIVILENYFKKVILYFDELQKVKFWRQYSLLSKEEKVQFELNRLNLEVYLEDRLEQLFDVLAIERSMAEKTKEDMTIMVQIMIQGIVEMRLMNSNVIHIDSIIEVSWRSYLEVLKNNP